ncbi:hypothetical protein [Chitinophaga vietnamensis]|uniref:hypothetical protein n=1 Tax=Chitinophaga vietnamensis TaxID=2593957 RepID=UPI00117827A6|nr:hypothetical protein [Chitinophaga vietnamensis]
MKQLLCIWGWIWMALSLQAQEQTSAPQDLVIHAKTLKKGLYKTFREFQTNSPSEEGDLVIKERSAAAQIYLLANRNELVIRDASGQEHKVKNYWGFCDGKNVYIKDNGLNRITEMGYYCIYQLKGIQPSRGYYNSADMTVNNINTPYTLTKVINIVTGDIYELSAYNLKKYILPQDNTLLEEFRSDREKKDDLEYYIFRFNERNKPR